MSSRELEGQRGKCGLFIAGGVDNAFSLIRKKPVFPADRASCGLVQRGTLPALVYRESW